MAQKKRILQLLLTAALLGLFLWLFIPRSIYRICGVEPGEISRITLLVQVDVYENGTVDFLDYTVDWGALEEDTRAALLEILEGKGYHPEIGNLLPWKASTLSSQGAEYRASVMLICDQAPPQAFHLTMMEPGCLALGTPRGFKTFRPLDVTTLEKLYNYAITYGTILE